MIPEWAKRIWQFMNHTVIGGLIVALILALIGLMQFQAVNSFFADSIFFLISLGSIFVFTISSFLNARLNLPIWMLLTIAITMYAVIIVFRKINRALQKEEDIPKKLLDYTSDSFHGLPCKWKWRRAFDGYEPTDFEFFCAQCNIPFNFFNDLPLPVFIKKLEKGSKIKYSYKCDICGRKIESPIAMVTAMIKRNCNLFNPPTTSTSPPAQPKR